MTDRAGKPTARITVDTARPIGPIDRRLFGSFIEHLGRAVYDGIFEPAHPLADRDGFRTDVLELVRELGVTTIRYPGGNFVSGYRWEDGVGPAQDRPVRLDLAWHSTETNEVGLHEFARWISKTDCELMLAVNLGTRGVAEAIELIEYSNVPGGSTLSDLRRANGAEQPFGVQMWCLGNEMDGDWQLGHCSATDYAKLASQTAKALRQVDPSVQLVACGSSSAEMPTFLSWESTVLAAAYDDIDYLSCHAYYEEEDGDRDSFLASGVGMDRFIESVASTIDHEKALRRTDKTVQIAFDEWNVWYLKRDGALHRTHSVDDWPVAPRLFEETYTVVDAVVVGGLLISLLKHADRVTSANLAQLVNVIAPITTVPGGPSWRQATFLPFAATARLARGTAVSARVDSRAHGTRRYGEVDLIDAVAATDGDTTTVFVVSRELSEHTVLTLDVASMGDVEVVGAQTLHDPDPAAANTLADQHRVALRDLRCEPRSPGELEVRLPPCSWSAITMRRRAGAG